MTTAQLVSLVSALVSAILSVLAGVDPGGVLARPDIQGGIVTVFAAAVPLFVALWAYFHHQTMLAAAQNAAQHPLNKLEV